MNETANDIKKQNPSVQTHCIQVDFNTMFVDQLQKTIEANLLSKVKLEDISVLVNNVGTFVSTDFVKCTMAEITRQIQVNIYPSLMMTNLLLPHMLKRQSRSCIVDLASGAGYRPMPIIQMYSASKSFISFMSQGLSAEYGYKIDFKCLHPNLVKTEMTKAFEETFWTISPKTCAEGTVRELGYPGVVTSGPWKHKLYNFYQMKLLSEQSFHEKLAGPTYSKAFK